MKRWIVAASVLAVLGLAACRMLGIGSPGASVPGVTVADGPVDNSRCHVCHMNYEDEKLSVTHAKIGVGCEACHGQSDPHCGDEDNVTPPDRMIPADKVNPFCMQCHPLVKLVDKTEHKPVLKAIETNTKRCTGCHGDHVMAERTVRWDKVTRKLLPKKQ